MPEYGNNGYIGTWLCDEDAQFQTPPTVELSFSHSFSETIPGLTIIWSSVYGEWATKFRVTAYHGERAIYTRLVENAEVKTVMSDDISGYDKIVLEILAWSVPFHRARIEYVFLGIERTYGKADIISYSADMFVDPLSASLPKSEITFELEDLEGAYNPDNHTSQAKYLMERQEVTTRYGLKLDGDIEWIDGGTYYLSDWEMSQRNFTATFTARDALEYLTDPYTGTTEGTLYDIADAAFTQADFPEMRDGSPRWYIHPSLQNIMAPVGLDEGEKSIQEIIQCVANAACCVFYQTRNGQLRVEPLTYSRQDYSIDLFNNYAKSGVRLSKRLKAVNVNNGQLLYTVDDKGETQPVQNPFISDQQAAIVAGWVSEYLHNRRTYSGNYRPDPRLDPLDLVGYENEYGKTFMLVSHVQYTYNGAFRGSYEGRSIDSLKNVFMYSGEMFAWSGMDIPDAI